MFYTYIILFFNDTNRITIESIHCVSLFLIGVFMLNKEDILSTIRIHKSELEEFGIQNIGLFGSYVRDEQSEKSDIDLLIDFSPEKETFDNFMAAYDFFEDLFKNAKIEIVTKNGLSPHIGPTILNEVIYA